MPTMVLLRGLAGTGKSTLLSLMVNRDNLNLKKLEIDDIKVKNHGETSRCNPEDFRESGRKASRLLGKGFGVVAAEAFCSRIHIDYFLSSAKISIYDPRLLFVRLECSLETAIQRKKGQLDPRLIRQQYGRTFQNIEGELVIDSEKYRAQEIADAVAKRVIRMDLARHKERGNNDSAYCC